MCPELRPIRQTLMPLDCGSARNATGRPHSPIHRAAAPLALIGLMLVIRRSGVGKAAGLMRGYDGAMTKHHWLLLITAGFMFACSKDVPAERRISVVVQSNPYDTLVPPLDLPDTVRRGQRFTLTFITVYASPTICWKPDGETTATQGRQTRITPWEVNILRPGDSGPCDLLEIGLRSTTVTLNTPGVDTITVVGRVVPYHTPNGLSWDSVSASVVVLP